MKTGVRRKVLPEKENWVPMDAYRLANDVRTQTNGNISPSLIHQLLLSLNKIYLNKERVTVNKLKKDHKQELDRLKRSTNSRGTLDGVTSTKGMKKARADLKATQSKLVKTEKELKRMKSLPQGVAIIDTALQAATAA